MLLTFRATALALLSSGDPACPAAGAPRHGARTASARSACGPSSSAVLGPEHAAEHASRRALVRSKKGRAALRKLRRRERTVRPLARMAAASNEGSWAGPYQLPVFGIHTTMLPTGKVLFFSYDFFKGPRELSTENNTATAYVWHPVTKTSKSVPPPLWTDPATGKTKPVNIWCGGLVVPARRAAARDGRHSRLRRRRRRGFRGLNAVYTFDPFTETWAEQPRCGARHAALRRALVPDADAASGRAHAHHERLQREPDAQGRREHAEPRHRAVHPGADARRRAGRSRCWASAAPSPPRTAADRRPTRTCSDAQRPCARRRPVPAGQLAPGPVRPLALADRCREPGRRYRGAGLALRRQCRPAAVGGRPALHASLARRGRRGRPPLSPTPIAAPPSSTRRGRPTAGRPGRA